jgi:ketosteroid isomerase-like protein
VKTDNLRVNQLTPEGYTWYVAYLEALDAKDVDRYGAFLADECTLIVNNADPITGRQAVLLGLSQYWQSFGDLEHDLLNIYGTDHAFMLEALNHYKRLDGKLVTLRAVALTDRNQVGKVTSVRLYTDTSPLFAGHTA